MTPNSHKLDIIFKTSVLLLIIGYICHIGIFILSPLLFSFFISLLLYPFASKLEKKGLGRVTSSALLIILFAVFVGSSFYLVTLAFKSFWTDFPDITQKFEVQTTRLINWIETTFNYDKDEIANKIKDNSGSIYKQVGTVLGSAYSSTTSIINFITLSPIYIFLMLLYRGNLKNFIFEITNKNNTVNIFHAFHKVIEVIKSYIYGMGLVIIVIATLNTILLLSLDIKHALVIGVLTALLTVIPYIGTIMGGVITVIITLVTKDSLVYPILVFSGYALIQFLEGNFISPKIIGDQVNINPLVAIISLVIGGSIWGIIGMVLALPVAATIRITLNHVEPLKPYSHLMETYINPKKEKK